MNRKNAIMLGMFLLVGILLVGSISAYTYSHPRYTQANFGAPGTFGFVGADYTFDRDTCEAGQDFILQIDPLGCSPPLVRSDLLAEQNVHVFCPVAATKINPLIEVEAIDYLTFRGDFAPGVANIGFHPARSALGYQGQLNSPILENIGYAVIELRQNPVEASIPDFIEGNVTARILYDIENAFGVGSASFYLKEMDDGEWDQEYLRSGFWRNRGYLRAENIEGNTAAVSIYSGSTAVLGRDSYQRRVATFSLEEGQTSGQIYIPTFDFCAGGLEVELDDVQNPDTTARLRINSDEVELVRGEKFLNGRCEVERMSKFGINQEVIIECREDLETGFGAGRSKDYVLKIVPNMSLKIDNEEFSYQIGDRLYDYGVGAERKTVYLSYAYTEGDSTDELDLKVNFVAIPAQPESKTRLTDEEISSFKRFVETSRHKEFTGIGLLDFSSNIFRDIGYFGELAIKAIVDGETHKEIGYKESEVLGDKEIEVLGFSGPVDASFAEGNEDYHEAIDDFDTLINDFSNQETDGETVPGTNYGEEALYQKIRLANSMDQKILMLNFCEEFEDKYPNSNLTSFVAGICKEDLELSNIEVSKTSVLIDGELKEISLRGIHEPSYQEYGAEILVEYPGGTTQTIRLGKNERFDLVEDVVEEVSGGEGLEWPVEDKRVTSCFGTRNLFGGADFHDGIDIGGDGLEVFAAASGEVVHTCIESRTNPPRANRNCHGYGTSIIIDHKNGYHTVYNHLQPNSLEVRVGDVVDAGDQIALSGNTGVSTGAHLHFGVYQNIDPEFEDRFSDKGINPLCFLPSEDVTFDADSCEDTFIENAEGCEAYPGFVTSVVGVSPGDYIELTDLDEDFAKVRGRIGSRFIGAQAFTTNTFTFNRDVPEDVGNYRFTLRKVNLDKVAKVSINPRINYAQTEAEFSFKIGVDKRLIQLSPEKAQEKVDKLDDSIERWEKISSTLDTTVTGLKAACLATGATFTVTNILENLKGKGIARERVMRSDGGWYDFCAKEVDAGTYKNVDVCLNENSDAIDSDVQAMTSVIEAQNEEIKTLQEEHKTSGRILDENVVNTEEFVNEEYSDKVRGTLNQEVVDFVNRNKSEDQRIDFEAVDDSLSLDFGIGVYDVEDLKKIELYSTLIQSGDLGDRMEEIAREELHSVLSDVQENSKTVVQKESSKEKSGLDNVFFISTTEKIREVPISNHETFAQSKYAGYTVQGGTIDNSDFVIANTDPSDNKEYLIVYDVDGIVQQTYLVNDDNKRLSVAEGDNTNVFDVRIRKFDQRTYENKFERSSVDPRDPVLRYFETEPYKGLPAVVPFDLNNGWYAASRRALPVGANVRSFDESGRVNSFYLCNVGEDGVEENLEGDDICQRIDLANAKTFTNFAGLDPSEAKRLTEDAVNAIEQASLAYKRGVGRTVRINTRRGTFNVKVGEPAVGVPDIKCQDFMSPKECNILFNVCDPVICPSSRCNFGGAYPVQDVVQTGIIGGVTMCMPNFKGFGGDVYVPVCLTGVKAGVDGWTSVQKSYRDCLQTSIDTGQTVGICDEIHSIYVCDFMWRQGLPLAKLAIPKIVSAAFGQGARGGGEYLSVASAWEVAQGSANFFTQNYALNSFNAFKVRSAEGIGAEICKNFPSIVGPKTETLIDALTEPDSPPQYHGRFDEIIHTTTTVPPISQYKVFYHIFAGNDRGVFYRVYLKEAGGGSFFQDAPYIRSVDSGFIAAGDFATSTEDFTAPAGYEQLCIMVNGIEECGFKQVSTSLAVDFIEDNYLKDQAEKVDIDSENECVSGSASLYNLLNPNLQSAAESAIDPAIYEKGLIRICATNNPGQGIDPRFGTEEQRWIEVGHCGDESLKCWLDTNSVEDVINTPDIATLLTNGTATNLRNTTLNEIYGRYAGLLEGSGYYVDLDKSLEEIDAEPNLRNRIPIINSVLDRVRFSGEKARLFLLRGQTYAQLAVGAYDDWKEEQEEKRRQLEPEEEEEEVVEEADPGVKQELLPFDPIDNYFTIQNEDGSFDVQFGFTEDNWYVSIPYDEQINPGISDFVGPTIEKRRLIIDYDASNRRDEFPKLTEEEKNFIVEFVDNVGDYQSGIRFLIDSTGVGGRKLLTFTNDYDVEVFGGNIFKTTFEETGLFGTTFWLDPGASSTDLYFRYNVEWERSFDGRHDWVTVPDLILLPEKTQPLVRALEGKGYIEGVEIIFDGAGLGQTFGVGKLIDTYDNIIEKYSNQYLVDFDLIKSVISVESNFNPRAVSSAGAAGLMQLIPGTARDLGLEVTSGTCTSSDTSGCDYNGDERFDPDKNIEAGTKFLRSLLNRYDRYGTPEELALAAYNGGPARISKVISDSGLRDDQVTWEKIKGDVAAKETRDYPGKVLAVKNSLEGSVRVQAGTESPEIQQEEIDEELKDAARRCAECGRTTGLCTEKECLDIGKEVPGGCEPLPSVGSEGVFCLANV